MLRKRICKAQSCLQDRSRVPPMPSRTTLTPTASPQDEESSILTDPPYRPTEISHEFLTDRRHLKWSFLIGIKGEVSVWLGTCSSTPRPPCL